MNVAIAGFGIEGRASYDYWKSRGHEVTIVDERPLSNEPIGARIQVSDDAFDHLETFDMVVRTAGLKPSKLQSAHRVWSATNEFFEQCPAPIIGVTGTKGKGTTASLVAAILKAAGKTVHLVGNIGVPALEVLSTITPEDIVVYELSSFQLWDISKSPHVAVVLMMEPDHLDVHSDMDEYVEAKSNIRRHQTIDDVCFVHPTNLFSLRVAHASDSGEVRRYGVPDDGAVYVKSNTFFVQEHAICSVDTLQLVGAHNVDNACAAISAARVYSDDDNAVATGLRSFSGLPHRLKRVGEHAGVIYYNDSIATTPGSALAALQAFPEPKTLILGGKDKGGDYAELVNQCKETSTQVIVFGENGEMIRRLCENVGVNTTNMVGSHMETIVLKASEIAKPGSVVILSPAASSFDMFKNYADRGAQFIAAVEGL